MSRRLFFWGPQLCGWPVRFIRGNTEDGWLTVGVVTWLGSAFWCTRQCWCRECDKVRRRA